MTTSTLLDKLKSQIADEQRKYRNALMGNKEFWELKLIKNNIRRLQTSLQSMINALRGHDALQIMSGNKERQKQTKRDFLTNE